jgi:penicillin-binding protein 1A
VPLNQDNFILIHSRRKRHFCCENQNRALLSKPQLQIGEGFVVAQQETHTQRKTCFTVRNILIVLLLIAAIAGTSGLAAWSYVQSILADTPNVDRLLNARIAEPSVLLSSNGTHLATYSQGRQQRVDLAHVSPYVVQALIATEDHRFYEHHGVDWQRTLAAAFHTVNGEAQGGSTITQQLARNLFPEEIGRERTINRKLKEMATALKIERLYRKEEILETYLNTVPFLYNVVGIEMAARTYYDKPAADLDLQESATLIGMLKGTSYYNPVMNPGRAMQRRNVVLQQMVKYGMLAQDRFDAMREQPLQVKWNREADPPSSAPHFAAYVKKWLLAWAQKNGYNLYADGLTIESTIDDRLQEAATQAVERQAQVLQNIADVEWAQSGSRVASHVPTAYAAMQKRVEPFRYFWNERSDLLDAFVRETPTYRKAVAAGQRGEEVLAKLKSNAAFMQRVRQARTRLEAGFLAIDPGSGEVKAWVGSRDFDRDQFDHVGQAVRQPGSTFKPIVYGAALESGLSPDRPYQDVPVQIRSADGSVWRPTDMSGWSGRVMPMREGLVYSRNGITAQVMRDIGVPSIIQFAQAAGVRQSKLTAVPSLSLGTSPVTLLEMVSAYTTIARGGEYRAPLMVRKIIDRHGRVIADFSTELTEGQRAMSEQTALELIDMMRGVVSSGTGTGVRHQVGYRADIAGKTGTTQNNTDGWFILMHPQLVAGAWIGFNDARVTMRSNYWGQGGHNAVLLVGDFFRSALQDKLIDAQAQFPKPERMPPLFVDTDEWPPPTVASTDDSNVIAGTNGETMTILTPRGASPANGEGDLWISSGNSGTAGTSGASGMAEPSYAPPAPAPDREATPSDVNIW